MIKAIVLSLFLILVGCANVATPTIVTKEKVNIDPNILVPCQPLIKLDGSKTLEEVIVFNYSLYAECASKQKASIILIKQFSNIEDTK